MKNLFPVGTVIIVAPLWPPSSQCPANLSRTLGNSLDPGLLSHMQFVVQSTNAEAKKKSIYKNSVQFFQMRQTSNEKIQLTEIITLTEVE